MRRVSILALCLILALLPACSSKIAPPFPAHDRQDYTVDDAVAAFEGAGFTDVTTEPTFTSSSSKYLGKINTVSVGGNKTYSYSRSYSPDDPVIITYYKADAPEPTPDPTPSPTECPDDALWTDPEMIRDFAQSLDFSTRDLCSLSEAAYNDFFAVLSDESTSSLDRYNAAKVLQDTLGSYLLQLLDKECPEVPSFAEYQDCAEYYISYMMGVADATMTYLDDPTTGNLSAVQSDMEAVPQYAQSIVAARSVFLTDAGFSQEEIAAFEK